MKFGDKYELLESLTTGGVETFVANDKIRGERVLVHILQCDPQKANQPTVQWVLEGFRKLAPEPAATVLETGRYSGTLYAYLVSKVPEQAALDVWIRRYEAQSRITQEFPAPPGKPTPQSEAPTGEVPQAALPQVDVAAKQVATPRVEPPETSGPMTQLFREFDMQAKSGSPAAPPADVQSPASNLPKAGPINPSANPSGLHAAPIWNPEPPRISPPAKPELSKAELNKPEPSVITPASSFRPDFGDKTFPSRISAVPVKDEPKAGEFTSFFQGPFRADRPSETPALTPQQESPRKSVGDFTAIFGPAKPPVEESLPSSGIAGNEPAGTGFTGWFNSGVSSGTSSGTAGPAAPLPPAGLPRATIDPLPAAPPPFVPAPPKEPFIPPPAMSYVSPAPPIFPSPVPLNPPLPKPVAMPQSDLTSGGATRAFTPPVSEPTPGPPPPPSGPSAYTRVISVKALNPDAAAAKKEDAAKPPAFALPSLPPPPKPPKLPKVEVTPPPVTYWPLILTLTILFFVAVLLVLYFVLKH